MSSTAADDALAISANEAEASHPPADAAASTVAPAVAAGTKATATATGPNAGEAEAPNMSKNALKRLRRMQEWEDGREDRKRRRREKRTATKARRRGERAALLADGGGADPAALFAKKSKAPAQLVPVSIILDCDFDEYMTDKERVSMSGQVTRCYSENRNHKYKAHFWISGWGGRMRERFETAMESQHTHWKGVGFEEGDFLAAAVRARGAMRSDKGGEMVDSLRRGAGSEMEGRRRGDKEPFPLAGPLPELDDRYRDVVYLTSESPYTLERLEPNTSYIIGGLVDKNREKGLCYRRAVERGVRTARLPIGQYMVMQSRQILATNHVVEIMVKWLECEDWGTAFTQVIPKRKGGKLIGQEDGKTATVETGAAGSKDDDDDDDDDDDRGQSENEGGEADRAREADTAE